MLSHTCISFSNQYTSIPFAVYLAPTYAVLGIRILASSNLRYKYTNLKEAGRLVAAFKNVAGYLLTFPHAVWIDIPHDLAIIMLLILYVPTFIISVVT